MTTEIDRIMRDMKKQGITISVQSSHDDADSPAHIIAAAARRNGLYHTGKRS